MDIQDENFSKDKVKLVGEPLKHYTKWNELSQKDKHHMISLV